MAVCGIAVLLFVLLARPPRHGVVLVACSPLLAGALILSRRSISGTAALLRGLGRGVRARPAVRLAWLALGLAFAVKVYAVVLIPLAILWTLRRRGRGELVRGGMIWLVAVVAVFAPFAVVAPHGLWESLWGQVSRPIQVESLVASFLTTFGSPNDYVSHRSVAIAGHHGLAMVTTVVELACLVGLWIAFARGAAEPARFVRYAAACVCAFVVLGKVLSPQYLIWLVPLVALVYGRRGVAAALLLAAAMIETQYWFYAPRYRGYVEHHFHAPLVLLRNLILVALLVVLAAPARRKAHAPAPPDFPGTPRRVLRSGFLGRAGETLFVTRALNDQIAVAEADRGPKERAARPCSSAIFASRSLCSAVSPRGCDPRTASSRRLPAGRKGALSMSCLMFFKVRM